MNPTGRLVRMTAEYKIRSVSDKRKEVEQTDEIVDVGSHVAEFGECVGVVGGMVFPQYQSPQDPMAWYYVRWESSDKRCLYTLRSLEFIPDPKTDTKQTLV